MESVASQVTIFDKPLEINHEKDTKRGFFSLFRHHPAVTSEPTKPGIADLWASQPLLHRVQPRIVVEQKIGLNIESALESLPQIRQKSAIRLWGVVIPPADAVVGFYARPETINHINWEGVGHNLQGLLNCPSSAGVKESLHFEPCIFGIDHSLDAVSGNRVGAILIVLSA